MLVRATKPCYYDLKRRYPGQEFTLSDEKHFSSKCMELVETDEAPAPKPAVKAPAKAKAKAAVQI